MLPRLTLRLIPLLCIALLASVNLARAQHIGPYFGLGSARDSAGTTVNSTITCPTGQIFDGLICENAPAMGGLFGVFGVDFMFRPHLGINGEYAFHFSKVSYLPGDSLNMRPSFYDLNVLWQPFSSKRFVPFLAGGFGGARISLSSTGSPLTGVTDLSSFAAGSDRNHFQLHGAIGVKFYVRGNFFIRPTFDMHYATKLTDQFGRNLVVQYMFSGGYTFGGR